MLRCRITSPAPANDWVGGERGPTSCLALWMVLRSVNPFRSSGLKTAPDRPGSRGAPWQCPWQRSFGSLPTGSMDVGGRCPLPHSSTLLPGQPERITQGRQEPRDRPGRVGLLTFPHMVVARHSCALLTRAGHRGRATSHGSCLVEPDAAPGHASLAFLVRSETLDDTRRHSHRLVYFVSPQQPAVSWHAHHTMAGITSPHLETPHPAAGPAQSTSSAPLAMSDSVTVRGNASADDRPTISPRNHCSLLSSAVWNA